VHTLDRSVAIAKRARKALGIVRERQQLDASLHLEALRGEVLGEDGLGLGLGDEEEERVSGVLETDVEESHPYDSPAEVHP